MGFLYFFNLAEIIRKYGTLAFIETGTGFGFGVYHASQFPFRRIISIEIVAVEVERLRPAFISDKRIQLIPGTSAHLLPQILPQIDTPIVFWLDAHFPGLDLQMAPEKELDESLRLPLATELQLIKELRPEGRDVILIDDLRIYERDKFEWGNLDAVGQSNLAHFDSTFLYKTFEQTHTAQRFLKDTGYLALFPK